MKNKQPYRILIADDNKSSRKGLRALLNSFSNSHDDQMQVKVVGEAQNGLEAVAMAQELKPDLIFMDITMPRLDGLEATERIKKWSEDTKIVILSMHSDQQEAASQKGADEFIAKGTDAQIIKQVVRFFLNEDTQPGGSNE